MENVNPSSPSDWSRPSECPDCGAYHKGKCLDEHLIMMTEEGNGWIPDPKDDEE